MYQSAIIYAEKRRKINIIPLNVQIFVGKKALLITADNSFVKKRTFYVIKHILGNF